MKFTVTVLDESETKQAPSKGRTWHKRLHRLRTRESKAQRVIPCTPGYFVLVMGRKLSVLPDK
jgi:hypothetical protein